MVYGIGSVASDVLGGGTAGLGPPVSGVSPHRPLLLRSDVPWTPEGSVREPGADSSSASRRAHDPYVAYVLAGMADATEEGREYVFPQGVMDRLAVQEALIDGARRRRKRKKEDEAAELDGSADVAGGSSSSHRDDNPDGGGQGAAGRGCLFA